MALNFWEDLLRFHEKTHQEHPSGKAGLAAVREILAILGPKFKPVDTGQHPLKTRLQRASEDNYKWLIHFARKLEELVQIPGYESVLAGFNDSRAYPSALAEMDFALKLRLSGLSCKFVHRRSEPTSDLVAEVAGQTTAIEITSLNLPYEDAAGIDALSTVTMIASYGNCVSGGMWGRIPQPWELEEVKSRAEQAVAEANAKRRMVELNVPGLLTCYIAPRDLAHEIPATWRGSFVMRTQSPKPKKDRLARTIETKAKSQLSLSEHAILVVYDRFSSPDEAEQFLDERELDLVVGTFPSLAGVILVYPFSTHESPSPKRVDRERRSYVEYSLPNDEAERCVIWGNPLHEHRSVLEPIIRCLTDFPVNLARLTEPVLRPQTP